MLETRILKFYEKNYKKLLIIPLLLLIFSISTILLVNNQRGYIINKDVSLKGGLSATIISSKTIDETDLKSFLLSKFPGSDVSVRKIANLASSESGIIIEATDIKNEDLKPVLEEKLGILDDYSVQELGPGLGQSFFKEMLRAISFAFLFMAVVVFITFKKIVPSLYVVLSAGLDLTVTLAIISLMNLRLSSAGIAAFLMVVGYSVDTDVLLTSRVLKRKIGTTYEKTYGAFKTGMIMTLTTIVALTIGIIITNSETLKQMFLIIVIALFIDIISTWIMNASLITWYEERRLRKNAHSTNT